MGSVLLPREDREREFLASFGSWVFWVGCGGLRPPQPGSAWLPFLLSGVVTP
jgi:hypothetical protein